MRPRCACLWQWLIGGLGLSLALVACVPACAADMDGVDQLRAAVLDHELYLRDFGADRVLRWHWTGSTLAPDSHSALHAIAAFQAMHVELTHDVVIVEGVRRSLLRDGSGWTRGDPVPVRLEIVVTHADQATALPQLAGLLFFSTREEAVAALPPLYNTLLPGGPAGTAPAFPGRCDCADMGKPACEGKRPVEGLQPPKLLSQVDPQFSREARHKKFSGDVQLVCTVGLDGHPMDLWLAREVGLGLDESAVSAVRQYVFKPATCHGGPAVFPLAVVVNFRIF